MTSDILKILNYRMESVSVGHLAISYSLGWRDIPEIKVFFGGEQVIEGLATAFTNPAIESGIIHCRALLSFLGLSAKDPYTLGQRKGARGDDIVIETISGLNGLLSKITPQDAMKAYMGTDEEAEQALAYVLHAANKVLAHSTQGFTKADEASKLIEIAFRGVPTLMVNNFYNLIGVKPPEYKLQSRYRNE